MALNPKLSDTGANTGADAVCALLNNGYLRVYSGSQPTNANTALGAQVKLAELRWNATAFAASSGGIAIANAITSDTNTVSGTATWFRALKSDGTTVIFDGTVGTTGCNINLNTTTITSAGVLALSNFTFTLSEG